uniref:Uncharacterized protein n=1 Tax=Arundo donax TaxID=35708 RepID=A0A0A9E502_ARUDO
MNFRIFCLLKQVTQECSCNFPILENQFQVAFNSKVYSHRKK